MMVMMMMIFIENKPVMLLHGVANNIVIFSLIGLLFAVLYSFEFASFHSLQKHADDP